MHIYIYMCVCLFKTIDGFYQCLEVNNDLITSVVMILSLIINREWSNERRIEISLECYVSPVISPVHLYSYFTCIVQKGKKVSLTDSKLSQDKI